MVDNSVANMSGFMPSIDNLSLDVKDVHNILIIPVYGHQSKEETENFPKLPENVESKAKKSAKQVVK